MYLPIPPPTSLPILNSGSGKQLHSCQEQGLDSDPGRITVRPNREDFGRYQLIAEIGRGGMGTVYTAIDSQLNRTIALKLITDGQVASESRLHRFYAEVQAAAKLDHPGIVPLYDFGIHDGTPYYSMAFVDGLSLANKLYDGVLTPRDAAQLVHSVAEAVHYAHERNVIHRDIKPANILISPDGQPRITDFGLAKQLDGDDNLTVTGDVIGTPSFMSPEQARGEGHLVGPQADVYSLGALLMWLVSGRPPFQAASIVEILRQVVESDPIPLSHLNPDVGQDLQTICSKCLEKHPAKRYATAQQLSDDLRHYLNGEPITARPVGPVERAARWVRRKPVATALIVTSLLAVMMFVRIILVQSQADVAIANASMKSLEAEAADTRTTIAQQLAESERRSADQARYRSLLNQVRQDISAGGVGWTWKAIQRLSLASTIEDIGQTDDFEFASLKATVLSRTDIREGKPIALGFTAECLAFGPDGNVYLGQRLHGVQPTVLSVNPETGVVHGRYSASSLGPVFGNLTTRTPEHDGFTAIQVHKSGQWLFAGTRTGQIHCWRINNSVSASTGNASPTMSWKAHDFRIDSLCLAEDTNRLVSLCVEAHLKVWALELEGTSLQSPNQPIEKLDRVGQVDVSADGRWVAMRHGGLMEFFDLVNWRRLWSWPVDVERGKPTFSPDGRILANETGNTIQLLDVDSGRVDRLIPYPSDTDETHIVYYTNFSADNSLLAVTANHGDVRLYEVASGQLLATIQESDRVAATAVFSRDNRWLAVAGMQRTRVFEIRHPAIVRTLAASGVKLDEFDVDFPMLATATSKRILSRTVSGELHSMTLRALRVTDIHTGEDLREVRTVCRDHPDVKPLDKSVAINAKHDRIATTAGLAGPIIFPLRNNDNACRIGEMPNVQNINLKFPHGDDESSYTKLPIPYAGIGAAKSWGAFLTLQIEPSGRGQQEIQFGWQDSNSQIVRQLDRRVFRTADDTLVHVEQFITDKISPEMSVFAGSTGDDIAGAPAKLVLKSATLVPFESVEKIEFERPLRRLQFDPIGKSLWAISGTKQVVVWSLPGFRVRAIWKDTVGERDRIGDIYSLAVGEGHAYVGVRNGSVYRLTVSSDGNINQETIISGLGSAVRTLASQGDRLAVGTEDGRILTFQNGTKQSTWQNQTSRRIECLALSPSGNRIAIGMHNSLLVADIEKTSLHPLIQVPTHAPVISIHFGDTESKILTLIRHESAVRLWNLDSIVLVRPDHES